MRFFEVLYALPHQHCFIFTTEQPQAHNLILPVGVCVHTDLHTDLPQQTCSSQRERAVHHNSCRANRLFRCRDTQLCHLPLLPKRQVTKKTASSDIAPRKSCRKAAQVSVSPTALPCAQSCLDAIWFTICCAPMASVAPTVPDVPAGWQTLKYFNGPQHNYTSRPHLNTTEVSFSLEKLLQFDELMTRHQWWPPSC